MSVLSLFIKSLVPLIPCTLPSVASFFQFMFLQIEVSFLNSRIQHTTEDKTGYTFRHIKPSSRPD